MQLESDEAARNERLLGLEAFKNEKKKIEPEGFQLELQYDEDKKNGRIEANEKEREKILAVKTLKKEMNYKIRETQANLMALNDEQLQTTTRLTILQNH